MFRGDVEGDAVHAITQERLPHGHITEVSGFSFFAEVFLDAVQPGQASPAAMARHAPEPECRSSRRWKRCGYLPRPRRGLLCVRIKPRCTSSRNRDRVGGVPISDTKGLKRRKKQECSFVGNMDRGHHPPPARLGGSSCTNAQRFQPGRLASSSSSVGIATILQCPGSPRSQPGNTRIRISVSRQSVFARRCSRDTATLDEWMT